MYKITFPQKDATIYEKYPTLNSGIDQIIELTKFATGEQVDDVVDEYATWQQTFNSRILMQFDVTGLNSNAEHYLNLKTTETLSIPTDYTLYAYPLAEPWKNGNGNYHDRPIITNGASWQFRSNYNEQDEWNESSGSMLWASVTGGGSWNSDYECTQSFSNDNADVLINITPIINAWIENDIPNYGLILKHSAAGELNNDIFGSIKFFGRESHTIYIPKLQSYWNPNADYTGPFTGSADIEDDYVIYFKNLQDTYRVDETSKVRLGVRDVYPEQSYDRNYNQITQKKLPETTYYSIIDHVTKTPFVEFNTIGTKIQTDDNGHFFELDTSNFLPERYYSIIFKIERDGSSNIYRNSNFSFRVTR